jgi:hypothetical protein
MPNLTVSANVDTFMQSANKADMRNSLGGIPYIFYSNPLNIDTIVTGTTTVLTINCPAGTFRNNGDCMFLRFVIVATNAFGTGNYAVAFGSTVFDALDAGLIISPGQNYILECTVVKTGSGGKFSSVNFADDGTQPIVLNTTSNINYNLSQNINLVFTQNVGLSLIGFWTQLVFQPAS